MAWWLSVSGQIVYLGKCEDGGLTAMPLDAVVEKQYLEWGVSTHGQHMHLKQKPQREILKVFSLAGLLFLGFLSLSASLLASCSSIDSARVTSV